MTMIETGYMTCNARTMYERICSSITDMGRSWIKEQAKSVREFPVLPNGHRGLQIGWGFGFSHVGRRKILQPDGTLIWLKADYRYDSAAEKSEYSSKLTFDQVETAVTQLNQKRARRVPQVR